MDLQQIVLKLFFDNPRRSIGRFSFTIFIISASPIAGKIFGSWGFLHYLYHNRILYRISWSRQNECLDKGDASPEPLSELLNGEPTIKHPHDLGVTISVCAPLQSLDQDQSTDH